MGHSRQPSDPLGGVGGHATHSFPALAAGILFSGRHLGQVLRKVRPEYLLSSRAAECHERSIAPSVAGAGLAGAMAPTELAYG